jgi:hypothetical protein
VGARKGSCGTCGSGQEPGPETAVIQVLSSLGAATWKVFFGCESVHYAPDIAHTRRLGIANVQA